MTPGRRRERGDQGQATVELVALLPLLGLLALLAWQAVVAGQAVWLAAAAARAASRASAIHADPVAAARRVLPGALKGGVEVDDRAAGDVEVSIAVPAVVGGIRLGAIHRRARFAPQGDA